MTNRHLQWIQITFVDVFGTYCSVAVPGDAFEAASNVGVLFDGSALEGRARLIESDMRLLADVDTLVETTRGRARALGTVLTPDGSPWPGDPRTALTLVLDAEPELTELVTVGAELEFYLLDADDRPIDRGGYFDDVEGVGIGIARDAAWQVSRYGIPIEGCHHEAGPGQYEIDLSPLPPLRLADAIVIAKRTIKRLAADAGLRATFMARPLTNCPGSGLHLHVHAGDLLVDQLGELTKEGTSFVAGILAHARSLSALAAPNINSYRRLHAGPEAPSAANWGHVNRGSLVRVSRALRGAATIEYRGADPTANPYLLLAGLLVAGASGVSDQLVLGPPSDEEAGSFDPAAAVRYEPLPRNLDEALDALRADDVLADAFDPVLLQILEAGRRAELEEFRSNVTRWERDRYLEES